MIQIALRASIKLIQSLNLVLFRKCKLHCWSNNTVHNCTTNSAVRNSDCLSDPWWLQTTEHFHES